MVNPVQPMSGFRNTGGASNVVSSGSGHSGSIPTYGSWGRQRVTAPLGPPAVTPVAPGAPTPMPVGTAPRNNGFINPNRTGGNGRA